MYSSIDLQFRHRDVELSRMDKIRVVSGWDAAFQNFRVCLANVRDRLNCEKCVRTMLGLEALEVLEQTRAFDEDNVTPDMLSPFKITRTVNNLIESLLNSASLRLREKHCFYSN